MNVARAVLVEVHVEAFQHSVYLRHESFEKKTTRISGESFTVPGLNRETHFLGNMIVSWYRSEKKKK